MKESQLLRFHIVSINSPIFAECVIFPVSTASNEESSQIEWI